MFLLGGTNVQLRCLFVGNQISTFCLLIVAQGGGDCGGGGGGDGGC